MLRTVRCAACVAVMFMSIMSYASDDTVFLAPDKPPMFPGGNNAMMEYLGSNIAIPFEADTVTGKSVVRFVVNADGSVGDVKILRGLTPVHDDEVVRAVRTMSGFAPGEKDGKIVASYVTLPVWFKAAPSVGCGTIADGGNRRPPSFPGGRIALAEYLTDNLEWIEDGEEGRVVARFIVGEAGTIDSVWIDRHLTPVQDAEVIRLVHGMPRWEPAVADGVPVRSTFTLPVNFSKPERMHEDVGDTHACFPGGQDKMDEYLAYRLKWRDAPNVRAGNVVVEFFVNVDGSITGARILKGLSASQDRQVLSAIEKMPSWIPAKKNGKSIKTHETLVVRLAP